MITQFTRIYFEPGSDTAAHVATSTLPIAAGREPVEHVDAAALESIDVEIEVNLVDADFTFSQEIMRPAEILEVAARQNGKLTPALAGHAKIIKYTAHDCTEAATRGRLISALAVRLGGVGKVDAIVETTKGRANKASELSTVQIIRLKKALAPDEG